MSDAHDQSEGQVRRAHHGGGHHGPSAHEEHEGAPEWLISFADMVMLMMGFFVILFALNNNPAGRQPGGNAPDDSGGAETKRVNEHMLDLAISIRQAFKNPVSLDSADPRDAALVRRLIERGGRSETTDPGVKGHEHDVQSIRPTDYYALSGAVPFPEFSSELVGDARDTIRSFAAKVRGLRLFVEVRGHVSSVEAGSGPELAMRLAVDRAMIVAKALAEEGVGWRQMRLISLADNDRVEAYPASRAADRANARVEVVLTSEVVASEVPTQYAR